MTGLSISLNNISISLTNGPPVLYDIVTAFITFNIPSFKNVPVLNSKLPATNAGSLNCDVAENSPSAY